MDDRQTTPAFAETVAALVEAAEAEDVQGPTLKSLRFDLPVEMHANRTAVGGLTLASGPTTQHFETSIMPVLHRLRMTVRVEEGPDD